MAFERNAAGNQVQFLADAMPKAVEVERSLERDDGSRKGVGKEERVASGACMETRRQGRQIRELTGQSRWYHRTRDQLHTRFDSGQVQ